MNVRRASSTTMRSGVITRRTETCSVSRRISFIAMRLRTRRWTSSSTASPGSETSSIARANGRAAAMICGCCGKTFSSHQRATSGNDSSRSVSPVGAQSTMTQSKRPSSWWRLICSRLKSSSRPGRDRELLGADAVHAALEQQLAEPVLHRRPSCAPSRPARTTCWPHRRSPTGVGSPPSGGLQRVRRASARDRSRARRCACPPRRSAARSPRPPRSCRPRPCRCRGSSGAPCATRQPTQRARTAIRAGERAGVAREVHGAQAHRRGRPRRRGRQREGVPPVAEARRAREHRPALAQHGEGHGRDLVEREDEPRGPLGHARRSTCRASTGGWRR